MFIAAWMDIEIIILSEVIQTKTNIIHYHLDVNFKKMVQTNSFMKQKQTQTSKQTYIYQMGMVSIRGGLG